MGTSPISGQNRVEGIIQAPAERGEEWIEELGAELFFLVVAGEEDLMALVEAVDQTFDGVGRGRTHWREDSGSVGGVKSKVKMQKAKVKTTERSGSRRTKAERGGVKSKVRSQKANDKTRERNGSRRTDAQEEESSQEAKAKSQKAELQTGVEAGPDSSA